MGCLNCAFSFALSMRSFHPSLLRKCTAYCIRFCSQICHYLLWYVGWVSTPPFPLYAYFLYNEPTNATLDASETTPTNDWNATAPSLTFHSLLSKNLLSFSVFQPRPPVTTATLRIPQTFAISIFSVLFLFSSIFAYFLYFIQSIALKNLLLPPYFGVDLVIFGSWAILSIFSPVFCFIFFPGLSFVSLSFS